MHKVMLSNDCVRLAVPCMPMHKLVHVPQWQVDDSDLQQLYTGVVLGILTDDSVTAPISQTMLLAVQGPQPIAPCHSA